jgi:tRNA U34 2-thiouridine synthase MnmA/TrmU
MKRAKAIALVSGGLDSTLALALVKEQGVEIEAVNFSTGFCFTDITG